MKDHPGVDVKPVLESLAPLAVAMRYLPMLVLLWLAVFFGRTLRAGAVPLIERVARVGKPDLSPALCRYTRGLTALWTVYFVAAAILSAGSPTRAGSSGRRRGHGLGRVLRRRDTGCVSRLFPRRVVPGAGAADPRHRQVWRPRRDAVVDVSSIDAAAPRDRPWWPRQRISTGRPSSRRASLDLAPGPRGLDRAGAPSRRRVGRVQPVHLAPRLPDHLPGGVAQSLPDGPAAVGQQRRPRRRAETRRPRPIVVGDAEAWRRACVATSALGVGAYVGCRPEWQTARGQRDDARLAAGLGRRSPSCSTPRAAPASAAATEDAAASRDRRAACSAARLDKEIEGGLAVVERIVCSVPPQHMFGLECSVMLPLVHGMPVLDRRPLLPADVARCVRATGRAAPGSRRRCTCAAWSSRARPCRRAASSIASTMPLAPRARAAQSEALLACAGARDLRLDRDRRPGDAAHRARDRAGCRWTACSSSRVDGATLARGSHFASPVEAARRARSSSATARFTLLGRQADLIKIAGRRASLAGLNLLLQDLPGLEDGVFYLPATGNPTERLCLIYAGPPLDRAATRRWLRARLDPVFLPRDLHPARALAAQRERQAAPACARPRLSPSWQSAARAAASRAAVARRARFDDASGADRMVRRNVPDDELVEGQGGARQRRAHSPDRLAGPRRRPAVCRAAALSDRRSISSSPTRPRGAPRASSSRAATGRPARWRDVFGAHPLLRRHPARSGLHGAAATSSAFEVTVEGDAAGARSARGRQGLRAARLAPRQLRPHDAEEPGAARPADHRADAHRRALAGAAHRRHRRQQAADHSARPLRQLPARLRGAASAAASSSRWPTAARSRPRCRATSSAGRRRFRSGRMRSRRAPGRRVLMGFGLYEGGATLPHRVRRVRPGRARRQPRRGAAAGGRPLRRDARAVRPALSRRTGSTSFPTGQQQR